MEMMMTMMFALLLHASQPASRLIAIGAIFLPSVQFRFGRTKANVLTGKRDEDYAEWKFISFHLMKQSLPDVIPELCVRSELMNPSPPPPAPASLSSGSWSFEKCFKASIFDETFARSFKAPLFMHHTAWRASEKGRHEEELKIKQGNSI